MYYIPHYDVAGLAIIILALICLSLRKNAFKLVNFPIKILIACAAMYNIIDFSTSILLRPFMSHFYVLCDFLMLLYFIFLILYPQSIIIFIMHTCEIKYSKALTAAPTLLFIALVISNPFTHLFYRIIPEPYSYLKGPINGLPYLLYAVSVINLVAISLRHKRLLGVQKIIMYCVAMLISAVVMAFQFIFPELLLTGFMMSIIVLMIILVYYFTDITHDSLTGLRNKLGFERKISELMYYKPNEEYVFGRVEVYNIQNANERFGREHGDQILISIADHLYNDLETKGRVCCRLGGNTFGILLQKDDIQNTPLNLHVKDLIQTVNNQNDYMVSIYIGFCPVSSDFPTDIAGIIERANFALSKVRGNFYNNICYFESEVRLEYEHKKEIEQRIWNAVQKEEFKVYLQPIYETDTKKCVSAEALVRWVDKNNTIIPPSDFVPIFEDNGFISELDMYVLEHVCKILKKWEKNCEYLIPISVNISRVDIENPDLVDKIVSIVDKYQVKHELIKIEITEGAFNKNETLLAYTMQNLRNNGFLIMMDDFGSGYSNLNMFKNLPIDIVKFDMKFMEDIETSEKGIIIVSSVVSMAKLLGLKIVVEGVETYGQFNLIRRLGCDMIQGYYFAKPMPVDDFNKINS